MHVLVLFAYCSRNYCFLLSCVQILFEDIQSHFENVQVLNELMTQLSDLCVEGDKDFITDHTNSLSAHIDDLKEGTEGRKDLLETRMESWKAFPVQAAVDVQEFLEAVSKEVGEEEEDFDDCSTAELMEKLERLEVRGRERLFLHKSYNYMCILYFIIH